MKKDLRGKISKAVAAVLVASACGVTCASLAGCAKTQSVSGEMHYEQWNTQFGIKVGVQMQSDKKGDRIRKVTVENSDYVSASPSGWDINVWNDNLQSLLNSYRGLYVADVLGLEVVTDSYGAPVVKDNADFVNYGDNLIITGATLGSGRLLMAVQDALSKLDGYTVTEGEYSYNAWGTDYGAKVRVVLKNGVIKKVTALTCNYINATPSWDTSLWYSQVGAVLAAYEGKTVEEVLAVNFLISGVDGATENSVSDDSLLATGATMSSARLVRAVQDALSKVNG